ncbi:hypothetical protein MKS88_000769 [Plasmodium brasilianum]|uniref:Uncharacterized protein n=1 Tax=Plasmodium brasilianum TaxID=5824 RepID=A0ACB9YFE0_PLABR|nr:hypothetical protein MKS88_000769 [Plasmodium brasilianum]
MGRDIKEFYNLRRRNTEKKKERSSIVIRNTRNKITCNNGVLKTSASNFLDKNCKNKDGYNSCPLINSYKVKSQKKMNELKKDYVSCDEKCKSKDNGKPSEGTNNVNIDDKNNKNEYTTGEPRNIVDKNGKNKNKYSIFYVVKSYMSETYDKKEKINNHIHLASNKEYILMSKETKNDNEKFDINKYHLNNSENEYTCDVLNKNMCLRLCTSSNNNFSSKKCSTNSIVQNFNLNNVIREYKNNKMHKFYDNKNCNNKESDEYNYSVNENIINANLNAFGDDPYYIKKNSVSSMNNNKFNYMNNIYEHDEKMNEKYYNKTPVYMNKKNSIYHQFGKGIENLTNNLNSEQDDLPSAKNINTPNNLNILNEKTQIKRRNYISDENKTFYPKCCLNNFIDEKKKNLGMNFYHSKFINNKENFQLSNNTNYEDIRKKENRVIHNKNFNSKSHVQNTLYKYSHNDAQSKNNNVNGSSNGMNNGTNNSTNNRNNKIAEDTITPNSSGKPNNNDIKVNIPRSDLIKQASKNISCEYKFFNNVSMRIPYNNYEQEEKIGRGISNHSSSNNIYHENRYSDNYSNIHNIQKKSYSINHNCNRIYNGDDSYNDSNSDDEDNNDKDNSNGDDKNNSDANKDVRDGGKDSSDLDKDSIYGGKNNSDLDKDSIYGGKNNSDLDKDSIYGGKNNIDLDKDSIYGGKNNIDLDKDSIYGGKNNIDLDKDSIYGGKNNSDLDKDSIYGGKNNIDLDKDSIYGGKNNSDGDKDSSYGCKSSSGYDKRNSNYHNRSYYEGEHYRKNRTDERDYNEESVKQTMCYDERPLRNEVSNLYDEILNKHINSSDDIKNNFSSDEIEKKDHQNKCKEKNLYSSSNNITFPIHNLSNKNDVYHNWKKNNYHIFDSLNDIIHEVKKKSNLFLNNYKNKDITIENNVRKNKIYNNSFCSKNNINNLSTTLPPVYEDSNFKNSTNTTYVNSDVHEQQRASNHSATLRCASHSESRSNIYSPEKYNANFKCNMYRHNYSDDNSNRSSGNISGNIRGNSSRSSSGGSSCSRSDGSCGTSSNYNKKHNQIYSNSKYDDFHNEKNKNFVKCCSINNNNVKMQTIAPPSLHDINSNTNASNSIRILNSSDKSVKCNRKKTFEFINHHPPYPNIIEENNFEENFIKNVQNKIDSNLILLIKNEVNNYNTIPFNDRSKVKDKYFVDNHNQDDNLTNNEICDSLNKINKTKILHHMIDQDRRPMSILENSFINSNINLKKEVPKWDMNMPISNGLSGKSNLFKNRNILHRNSIHSIEKGNNYHIKQSDSAPGNFNYNMISQKNYVQKGEDKRTLFIMGNGSTNHNSLKCTAHENNYILLEDDKDEVNNTNSNTYEQIGVFRNKMSKNVNTNLTKYYKEQNCYECIEDSISFNNENTSEKESSSSNIRCSNNFSCDKDIKLDTYNCLYGSTPNKQLNTNNKANVLCLKRSNKDHLYIDINVHNNDFSNTPNDAVTATFSTVAATSYVPNGINACSNVKEGNGNNNFKDSSNSSSNVKCGGNSNSGSGSKDSCCAASINNNKNCGNSYLTRSKSCYDIQCNYSEHSIDSIYDGRRNEIYEYDSVMGRKKLKKQKRPKLIQISRKKRKTKSLNDIKINYSLSESKLMPEKKRKKKCIKGKSAKSSNIINDIISNIVNNNDENNDLLPLTNETLDQSFQKTKEELHPSNDSNVNSNCELSVISESTPRAALTEHSGTKLGDCTKINNVSMMDYYRNYDSVQSIKGDILKNEKFPFIFYDSNIRNLVIYYKDDYTDAIKSKYFSAQRFGHATAKKIALNFLRSLGINPDHLENNNVFSYEKDAKSKLFNMTVGKVNINKDENSNVNYIYDKKKRNVIVSWINKNKGYTFRKFSTQRFGFDVAVCLSIDFYKNLGGLKEEEEIRNYIDRINSSFKNIRILTSKKKKLFKNKVAKGEDFLDICTSSYENIYDCNNSSFFFLNNVRFNIENMKNQSMFNGVTVTTYKFQKYTNLFYITNQFYQILESKLKNIQNAEVKINKICYYDFFLNRTFYFLYLKCLENVKSIICDENIQNFIKMYEQVKNVNNLSYQKVQDRIISNYTNNHKTNYFQIIDHYCDSEIHKNYSNRNVNYFISKIDYYRDDDILMKGYYTSDDATIYEILFLSNDYKNVLDDEFYFTDPISNVNHNKLTPMDNTHKRMTRTKKYKNRKNFQNYHFYYNNKRKNMFIDYDNTNEGENEMQDDKKIFMRNKKKMTKYKKRNKNVIKRKNILISKKIPIMSNRKGKSLYEEYTQGGYEEGTNEGECERMNEEDNEEANKEINIQHNERDNFQINEIGNVQNSQKDNIQINEIGNVQNSQKNNIQINEEDNKTNCREINICMKKEGNKEACKDNSTCIGEEHSRVSRRGAKRGAYKKIRKKIGKRFGKGTKKRVSKRINKEINRESNKGTYRGVNKRVYKRSSKGTNKMASKMTSKMENKVTSKMASKDLNNISFLRKKKFASTNKNINSLLMKGRKYILCYNYMGKFQVKVFSADIYGAMTAQKKSVAFLQQVKKELKSDGKILYSDNNNKTAFEITNSLMKSVLLNPLEQQSCSLNNGDSIILTDPINTIVKKKRERKRKNPLVIVDQSYEKDLHCNQQIEDGYNNQRNWEQRYYSYKKEMEKARNASIQQYEANEMNAQNRSYKGHNDNYGIHISKQSSYLNSKINDSADDHIAHYIYESEHINKNESTNRVNNIQSTTLKASDGSFGESKIPDNCEQHDVDNLQNDLLCNTSCFQNKNSSTEDMYANTSFNGSFRNDLNENVYEAKDDKNISSNNVAETYYKINSFECTEEIVPKSYAKTYSFATEYEMNTTSVIREEKINSTIRSENEGEKEKKEFLNAKQNELNLVHVMNLDIHNGNSNNNSSNDKNSNGNYNDYGNCSGDDDSNGAARKDMNKLKGEKNIVEHVKKERINCPNSFNKLNPEQKIIKGYMTLRKEQGITPNVKRVYSLYDLYNKIINECDYTDFLSQGIIQKILKNKNERQNEDVLTHYHSKRLIIKNKKIENMKNDHIQNVKINKYKLINKEIERSCEYMGQGNLGNIMEVQNQRDTENKNNRKIMKFPSNQKGQGEKINKISTLYKTRNFYNDWSGLVKYYTSKGVVKIPKICVHKLARKKGYMKLTCIIYRGKGEFVSYFLERTNKKVNDKNIIKNENDDNTNANSFTPYKNNEKYIYTRFKSYKLGKTGSKEQNVQAHKKYFLREKQNNFI